MTLLELNSLVRQVIELELRGEYWVEAELSECRENRGHGYLELIQRNEHQATPVAKASAKCWASKWMLIRPHFERVTGQRLQAGMKVLLKVYPQFHEAYGFSWIVTDIDPTFTLGDQARRRQEIIKQLKQEGVFDLQRELHLPLLCLRIAVISSQTAAGYGDFCNQLGDTPFAFRTRLFPATMQGEDIEQSVVNALNRINAVADDFDCVVIIRGGGSTSDLSGFDTLLLAENVANFPLPVITGIGHDRDECILDMVSHQRVKTPTAAAAFLAEHAQAVLDSLDDAQNRITRHAQHHLTASHLQLAKLTELVPRLFTVVKTKEEARLEQLANRLNAQARQALTENRGRIDSLRQRLPMMAERRLTTAAHKLELMAEQIKARDPRLLLRRGYSITLKDGHALRNPQHLKTGDEIETIMEKGTIKSIIT
jgi:exodeoxyribonuclease VII large subunit